MQYGSFKNRKYKPTRIVKPFGRKYWPKLKPKVLPGVCCPVCPILGNMWLYTPDGHIKCYGCGYKLPERFELPL